MPNIIISSKLLRAHTRCGSGHALAFRSSKMLSLLLFTSSCALLIASSSDLAALNLSEMALASGSSKPARMSSTFFLSASIDACWAAKDSTVYTSAAESSEKGRTKEWMGGTHLAGLLESGHLHEGLLLVDELHHAAADLGLEVPVRERCK